MRNRKTLHGFNLIELMIAMVIGLILLAGVYQLMISSKRTYNLQSDLARLQEGARFALDFMSSDFRMLGYFGCTGALTSIQSGPALGNEGGNDNMFVLFGSDNTGWNGSDMIRLAYMDSNANAFAVTHCTRDFNNDGIPNQQTTTGGENVASQNCEMQRTNANFMQGANATPLTALTTQLASFGLIENNERVLAADCGSSDIYRITAAAGNPTMITITPALTKNYDNAQQSYGAELRRFVEVRYFVAQNPRGGVSLFKQHYLGTGARRVNDARPNTTVEPLPAGVEEVIEGVENMQLRYNVGQDTNNDGVLDQFQYVTAANVGNWQNVRSVMITLLMQTVNQRFDMEMDTDTYPLDPSDAAYGPVNDYRARMVFGTTVMVRNN